MKILNRGLVLAVIVASIGATGVLADDNGLNLTSRSPEVAVFAFGIKLLFGSMFLMHSAVVQIPGIAATLPVAGQNTPPIVSFSAGVGLISSALYDVVSYCHQNLPNNRRNR